MSVGVYVYGYEPITNLFNVSEFCKPFIVVRQIFLGVMMGVLIDLILFSDCVRLWIAWIKYVMFTNMK